LVLVLVAEQEDVLAFVLARPLVVELVLEHYLVLEVVMGSQEFL
jgi:hypothetical protein